MYELIGVWMVFYKIPVCLSINKVVYCIGKERRCTGSEDVIAGVEALISTRDLGALTFSTLLLFHFLYSSGLLYSTLFLLSRVLLQCKHYNLLLIYATLPRLPEWLGEPPRT